MGVETPRIRSRRVVALDNPWQIARGRRSDEILAEHKTQPRVSALRTVAASFPEIQIIMLRPPRQVRCHRQTLTETSGTVLIFT